MTDFATAMEEHFSYGDMEKSASMFTAPIVAPSDPGDASVGANIRRAITPMNIGLTLAGGVGGGLLMRNRAKRTKSRPGETEEERRARINRAAIKGGLLGAAVPAGLTGAASFVGNVQPNYGTGIGEMATRHAALPLGAALGGRALYRGAVGGVAAQKNLFQQRALSLYDSLVPNNQRNIKTVTDFLNRPGQWYADITANTSGKRLTPHLISELRNAGLIRNGAIVTNADQLHQGQRLWRSITGAPKTLYEHLAGLQRYSGVDQPIGPQRARYNPYRKMPRPAGGMLGRPNPRGRAAAVLGTAGAGWYFGNRLLDRLSNHYDMFED